MKGKCTDCGAWNDTTSSLNSCYVCDVNNMNYEDGQILDAMTPKNEDHSRSQIEDMPDYIKEVARNWRFMKDSKTMFEEMAVLVWAAVHISKNK